MLVKPAELMLPGQGSDQIAADQQTKNKVQKAGAKGPNFWKIAKAAAATQLPAKCKPEQTAWRQSCCKGINPVGVSSC